MAIRYNAAQHTAKKTLSGELRLAWLSQVATFANSLQESWGSSPGSDIPSPPYRNLLVPQSLGQSTLRRGTQPLAGLLQHCAGPVNGEISV